MNSRAVIACAIGALLSGCASTPSGQGGSAGVLTESRSAAPRNPALVFATPEMREMLAKRQLPPGFGPGDWEFGRNDQRLSIGAPPPRQGGFSAFQITQYDQFYDTGGRPRNASRTTIRSERSGVSR